MNAIMCQHNAEHIMPVSVNCTTTSLNSYKKNLHVVCLNILHYYVLSCKLASNIRKLDPTTTSTA